jgi:hypothetical protein
MMLTCCPYYGVTGFSGFRVVCFDVPHPWEDAHSLSRPKVLSIIVREHLASFREHSAAFREHSASFREHSASFREHSASFGEHSASFGEHSHHHHLTCPPPLSQMAGRHMVDRRIGLIYRRNKPVWQHYRDIVVEKMNIASLCSPYCRKCTSKGTAFRERTGNIQWTFREHSASFRENSA